MQEHIVYKGGARPNTTGFATPHIAGLNKQQPDEPVNDSLGSITPADTMDTDPGDDPEAGGKGTGPKTAE